MSRALITINGSADRERAIAWINKSPAGTRIEFKAAKRSIPQNERFWAMLTDVATQHSINGRKYTTEEWKMMFLAAYAEVTGAEIRYLPAIHRAGMIPAGRSSSDLSVQEMSEVIDLMAQYGSENGVVFKDDVEAVA